MVDLRQWPKRRRSQVQTLLALAVILLWMSLSLWQAEQNFHVAMRSHERFVRELETARELQLDRLGASALDHQARQDLNVSAIRADLTELRLLIMTLFENNEHPAVR